MKILITGGAGFIGSHLAERLVTDGHGVLVLDNLSTGSLDNIAGIKDRPGFECVIGSVRDASLVQELVQICDVTVHLAAAVGVRLILDKPSLSIHTNVNGTENVLHAASTRNKLVIIASSSEVYGKSKIMPFGENDDLVLGSTANLRWSYACAKALDECMALSYSQEKKLSAIIVRLFNTAGPRQTGHYGMVLPGFVNQALKGEPITVYGTGEQTRCFAHVADVVESLVRLMNAPSAFGEVFNVGNDQEISIEALAQRVKAVTASASAIQKLPYREVYGAGFEDMVRRVPDVRKLERFIGYRPRTSLDRIIADVVAEQKAALGLA
jgi:nucleoside-diphosphate-sugar epimerase